MSESKQKYPYKEAVLSDAKGDISKRWYVNYYVWSERQGKLVRKRGVFDQPTKKERYEGAQEFIEIINDALKEGYIIEPVEADESELSAKSTVEFAVTFFLNHKTGIVSRNTIKGYTKDLKVFQEWAEKKGWWSRSIADIGTNEVYSFSDFLDTKVDDQGRRVNYSKKTFSNFIATLRTMWAVFVDREILKVNPFLKVQKRKGPSSQHIPYSSKQVKEFKKKCIEIGDEQLWLFVNFIYYCFLRPTEEAQKLQVKHLLERTIVVPGTIAKNNLTEHVRIPKPLEKLIRKYKLRSYPPNYFLFSKSGTPGISGVGDKYMYMHNRKVLELTEITDQEYDLYGWKHTGVIALYLKTKDIKLIQVQCRHKDISTTDKYLRELGLFLDEDVLDQFPAI